MKVTHSILILWTTIEGEVGIMAMKNPPHVGGLIRRQVIEPLGLTVTEAAKVLGVGRQALSSLLNEKTALTTKMGLRVEKAFGPKMEHLMRMQLAFDLAQARKAEHGVRVKRYIAKRAAIVRDGAEKKALSEWSGQPRVTRGRDG
jgi:addiction module HigA family antidote